MQYGALILDLDGTTVINSPDSVPSPQVTETIHKAKKFVKVCFATSRPLFMTKNIFDRLQPNGLCAVTDSTQIYDPVRKRIIQTYYLQKAIAPYAYKVFRAHGVRNVIINDGGADRGYNGGHVESKLVSICAADILPSVAEEVIEELSKIPTLAVYKIPSYQEGKVWVTVAHLNATKLHAVGTIAKLLKLRRAQLIGIGDGYNDFPLLMACGLRIAMGNAVPELKAIADFIAPTVEEDGVATVIEKFILNR